MEDKKILNTPYFSVREVAARFKVTRKHIYYLIKSGKIGHIKIGNAIRISEKDIESFERRNRIGIKRKEREYPF